MCADDLRNPIADLLRQFPPCVGPGIFVSVLLPRLAIGEHGFTSSARHWSEAVAEQVNARCQSREFLTATIDNCCRHMDTDLQLRWRLNRR